jgi:hypothetical protein
MMKTRREGPYGPPAIYSFPSQNEATEITRTNIDTKATIKFLVCVFVHLHFSIESIFNNAFRTDVNTSSAQNALRVFH